MEHFLEKNVEKKYILFGSGGGGLKLLSVLPISISYVVDNNSSLWNTKWHSLTIRSPQEISNEDRNEVAIIVASSFYDEIKSQLEDMNLVENVHFINGLDGLARLISLSSSGFNKEIDQKGLKIIKGIDIIGKVMIDNQSKKVYRGIYNEYSITYISIYDKCKLNNLFSKYVVATDMLSGNEFQDFGCIFEHDFIDPVIYPYEWSPLMFRDAALFKLELMKRLEQIGLGLKDAHPYNVTLHDNKFLLLDFGSIINRCTLISVLKEYINWFIHPMILLHKRNYDKAMYLLKNTKIGISKEDIYGYLEKREKENYELYYEMIEEQYQKGNLFKCIKILEDWITLYELPFNKTLWSNYHDEHFVSLKDKSKWNNKQRNVINFIQENNVGTVLDIAGNQGWFCFALDQIGIKSILTDYDHESINVAYKKASEVKAKITPMVLDFITPSPAYYMGNPIDSSSGVYPTRFSVQDRLHADVTLALALVHHLVFSQQLTFQEIVYRLNQFTYNYLIVEFILPEDHYVSKWMNHRYDWYTLDSFKEALEVHFKIVKMEKSYPEDRILLFCQKK